MSLYNLDPCSVTYGYGDRLYWGWKIADFANGTMQGGVHALAIALRLGLMEDEAFNLKLIDAVIRAISRIQAPNGSMAEAYPGENSFCVTALVAFDVLSAIRLLDHRLEQPQRLEYLEILRPLIRFLSAHDEGHAVISNHLATAAAAITLWREQSGEVTQRNSELLERVYSFQSEEGWFREYEGADPGYQTLCTYYLFHIWSITQDEDLLVRLNQSAEFLKYFVHPDGTIGGLYGSRNTEVYYPGGVVGLASCSDKFAAVANNLEQGIHNGNHILPQAIDIGNFIPLINTYAVAAMHYEDSSKSPKIKTDRLPFQTSVDIDFQHAGIYIRSNRRYYLVLNYKKGGTLKVFDKETNRIDLEDGGLFGRLTNGDRFSTQHFDQGIVFDQYKIVANFYLTNERYPTPFDHILLRLLGLTLFRIVKIGELFKNHIVRLLITRKKKIDGQVLRAFDFLEEKVVVTETIDSPRDRINVEHDGNSKSIHMASSGYYLRQIEQRPQQSAIVEFRYKR